MFIKNLLIALGAPLKWFAAIAALGIIIVTVFRVSHFDLKNSDGQVLIHGTVSPRSVSSLLLIGTPVFSRNINGYETRMSGIVFIDGNWLMPQFGSHILIKGEHRPLKNDLPCPIILSP